MWCYGYKLINYVFSVAVYDLLPPLHRQTDIFYLVTKKQKTEVTISINNK